MSEFPNYGECWCVDHIMQAVNGLCPKCNGDRGLIVVDGHNKTLFLRIMMLESTNTWLHHLTCGYGPQDGCTLHAPAPVTLQSQNDANEQSRTNADDKVQVKSWDFSEFHEQFRKTDSDFAGVSNPLAPTSETVGVSPKKGPEQ